MTPRTKSADTIGTMQSSKTDHAASGPVVVQTSTPLSGGYVLYFARALMNPGDSDNAIRNVTFLLPALMMDSVPPPPAIPQNPPNTTPMVQIFIDGGGIGEGSIFIPYAVAYNSTAFTDQLEIAVGAVGLNGGNLLDYWCNLTVIGKPMSTQATKVTAKKKK